MTQAADLLQTQDRVLKSFPEVERVFGKAGRADTSTDPAPLSMVETTVVLKPETAWRAKERWYSGWSPEWVKPAFPPVLARPHLLGGADRRDGPGAAHPGQTNAWTMPIKNRIDMLSTGVRTPVGIKVFGDDLTAIERDWARAGGSLLRKVPGTRSVYAERVAGGYFLDIVPRRDQLARYGLTIEQDMQTT